MGGPGAGVVLVVQWPGLYEDRVGVVLDASGAPVGYLVGCGWGVWLGSGEQP